MIFSFSDEYFSFISEFISAVYKRWPNVLVQFEDFENSAALPILQKYRDRFLCFNDGNNNVAECACDVDRGVVCVTVLWCAYVMCAGAV